MYMEKFWLWFISVDSMHMHMCVRVLIYYCAFSPGSFIYDQRSYNEWKNCVNVKATNNGRFMHIYAIM